MATRKHSSAKRFLHLILGSDAYLREEQREKIVRENVSDEARDFAVAKFSLENTRLGDILAQAETRPMLGERQVLLVSDVDRLREEDLKPLQDYLAAPADFTVLVFEAEDLDRRTRAAKLLLENCQMHEVEADDLSRALHKAQEFARELRIELDAATAEELVMALGGDLARLRSELTKLRAFVGEGGRLTAGDVAAVVVPARKFGVFELVAPLAERRRGDALRLLRRMLEEGESPIGMVGMLTWLYRQLLLARSLGPGARGTILAPRERIELLLREAPRFSPDELRNAFGALLEADLALKSSPPDAGLIMEVLVTKLAGGRPAVARR